MLWTVLSCTSFAGVLWLWGWVCFTEPISTLRLTAAFSHSVRLRDLFRPVWILTLRRLEFFKHLCCIPFWTSLQSRISCWLCQYRVNVSGHFFPHAFLYSSSSSKIYPYVVPNLYNLYEPVQLVWICTWTCMNMMNLWNTFWSMYRSHFFRQLQ